MDYNHTKQLTISKPTEVITLSAEDDFTEVYAHAQNGDLIGSFRFNETDERSIHLQWMFLDKISGYTRRGIGRCILEWVKEVTEMPIFVSEHTGLKYPDGSHLTGTGLPFACKMMDLGVIADNREKYAPDDELFVEDE
jgi:hypothetical protein